MYPQSITVRLKFSVQDICKLWSHCSHCKHDLYDSCEYPAPFSPEMMMIVIDHDTNVYILNDIANKYLQRKQKEAPKLAVEGNRFWFRSIITTTDHASFLDMVIKKPNTCTQIQDPISMHTDHNFCTARCLSENKELHSKVYFILKHLLPQAGYVFHAL